MSKKSIGVKIERIKEIVRKVMILQTWQKNILTRRKLDATIYDDYEGV